MLSLRARLLAGVGAVIVVLAIVTAVIASTTRSQLIDQIDDRLAASAMDDRRSAFDRLPPGERDGRGTRTDAPAGTPPERQSDFFEGAVASDGTMTTFYVPNIGGEQYEPPDVSLEQLDFDGGSNAFFTTSAVEGPVEYRVLAELDEGTRSAFITAVPLNDVESTINQLLAILLAGVATVLVVLGSVTWWMLRLGIRPIKQMTTTASAIAAGDLSARADDTSNAVESRDLAVALNTMMGTIETSLAEQEQSESRLRRFVSDASHELRTPVTTIRGYAELYRHGGLSDQSALDDAMRRTEQEAERMGRLVEDMLTLAKLDEERPIERTAVDVALLAHDAVADARAAAPGRSIELTSVAQAMVDGDADRLRQVLANLVNNALTHTDPDVSVEVTVHAPIDGNVRVEIRDEGPGIVPEVRERLTERFYRADPSRSRQRGGSGLGLAIVESTIGALGGTFRVDSEPGHGTTAIVDLPAAS